MKNTIFRNLNDPLKSSVNLNELNASQREAVTSTEGPLLVIAGAGSGKTRTLVYRVAYLLEQGIDPERILLLTFTRKASQEMLWRAGQLLNETCRRVVGGTFHGIANMLLRRHGHHLGFGSSFTIIDRADAEGIVNLLKGSLGLTGRDKQFPTKRVLINILSGSVNKSIPIDDLVYESYSHLSEHVDDILNLEKYYKEFKFNNGLMDYDDLLVNWKRLLDEIPEARQEMAARYSHIMVDEYQDTNLIQADIVRLLAHGHENVMVVGDDSQSIYSFRGADFYNIMRFPKVFKETKIIKLEENYRSTQPILSLTNDIMTNAVEKYAKTLFTRIEGKFKPRLFAGRDEREEAAFVSKKIAELRGQGIALNNIAVLFRSGFHSYKLEMELNSTSVDFEKRGGMKLTESAHMKDVIAFLRLRVNPFDTLSWNRILLHLDKVGPKTARKIADTIATSGSPGQALSEYPCGKNWRHGVESLAQLFMEMERETTPGVLYELVWAYYQPLFEKIYRDDFPKRQKDLDQLKSIVAGYADVQTFVDDTTLDPPETGKGLSKEDKERMILSTIHSSKGLEWDVVFVMGLADGRFPHSAAEVGEQWEEERRLLYVAATRARKYLYLTYPRELMTPDRQFRRVGMSPFLAELRAGLFERIDSDGVERNAPSFLTSTSTASSAITFTKKAKKTKLSVKDLSKGVRVHHPFFGEGVVNNKPQGRSVDVIFQRHGVKTLHLDYAKLTLV
ncbi:DNA/RNA helicase, superfamily I [Desulfocapsa sulfexigens DSM 10523]|uniref:DNA 3'-5' helicase n=1 Tax=Desulfocapsa sulfexigens (strain DSM 10523 / SB164P1) TaxID=1167006 RepID=M1NK69_DESSD|nr:ATP-dependent helicase [Desulfocapsa sulfexigens]AGF79969.1 DNA/RNA helicase, superfamily I [Desulfocapsa sulfexigens DSM 10523]